MLGGLSLAASLAAVLQAADAQIQVDYAWPLALLRLPVAKAAEDGRYPGVQGPKMASRLARVAKNGFDAFVLDVLPRQGEVDEAVEEESEDVLGRVGQGFLRWQKVVYAASQGVPLRAISKAPSSWRPTLGMNYSWPSLYDSADFHILQQLVAKASYEYLRKLSGNKPTYPALMVFMWAEVLRPGESQMPHSHVHSPVAGAFVARHRCDAQRIVIVDPRGELPPFGQRATLKPEEGELLLWPGWASHYVEMNSCNMTTVYYSFIVLPRDPSDELDWEDDVPARYVKQKRKKVKGFPDGNEQPARSEL